MRHDSLSDHPDLSDQEWLKKATTAAEKDIRRLRRKHKWRGRMIFALLLAPIVAVTYVAYQYGLFTPGQSVPVASAPSTVTSKAPDVVVDLNQPFAGTPAAGWADGEAGIVAPAAQPIGGHTAEQVADAYAKVRHVMITSRLDRAVIEGGDTERLLELYAPMQRAEIRSDLSDPTKSISWVNRIAAGSRLLPMPPKVTGQMSATVTKDGALAVHTDYITAYAFHTDRPEDLHAALDIIVVSRSTTDYEVTGDKWPKAQRGVWMVDHKGYTYSMACDAIAKGMLAPRFSEYRVSGREDSREPETYFDIAQPLPTEDGCAT